MDRKSGGTRLSSLSSLASLPSLAQHRAALALAQVLALAACGSGEETPAAPPIAPEPIAVDPTPAEPDPSAANATAPGPSDPNAAPADSPLAPGDVLAISEGSIEIWHSPISFDVVAYPPEVQEAIHNHLRSAMREGVSEFGAADDDSEFPSYASGNCSVTLALADLVSYACHLDLSIGRGGGDVWSQTMTWEVTATTIRELETDDLLVAGADLDAIAEAYDVEPQDPFAVGPTALVFVDYPGNFHEVPYADLGTLLDPSSIVARIPAALAASSVPTPLSTSAAPPTSVELIVPARSLPAAALLGARQGSDWLFPSPAGASVDATTPASPEVTSARLPEGSSSSPAAWATPLRLHSASLRRATQLRPAPRGHASGPTLPAGTAVVAVLGELGAGRSRTGGGQWAFVVASEGSAGWVAAGGLGTEVPAQIAARDAFVAALPEGAREAAARNALVVRTDDSCVVYAETSPGTTTVGWVATSGTTSSVRLLVSHAGTLADARELRSRAGWPPSHVLLAWLVPGDASHLLWEAYAPPASGTAAAAPALSTRLALPDARARERQTVATAVTRHGTYYPIVVRGPGRAETLYTWDDPAFVTPSSD